MPPARDFATDAYAHCKFIGHSADAASLFEACGLAPLVDEGFVALAGRDDVEQFLTRCAELRHWERQMASA
jgi:catalase